MIGLSFHIALAQRQLEHQLDAAEEKEARERLAPADFEKWRIDREAKRKAKQEVRRREEIAERQHRELCEAIRSTSFWRFGG